MYTIKRTEEFDQWFSNLRGTATQLRLAARLRKAQLGNLGDIKSIANNIFEMREHFGPGWRMYYVKHGMLLIIMLGGGDKSSQSKDIHKAIALAALLEDE